MNNFGNSGTPPVQQYATVAGVEVRPLMRLVYMWMTLGLLVTALVAVFVASNESLVMAASQLYLPLVIVQFGLVLGIGFLMSRISANVAIGLFFLYAGSMGLTLSVILFAFVASGQTMAIANAFFTTAGLFGVMTVIGLTTKVDLTRFGSFLMMGLIGLVIASFINMLFAQGALSWIISVVGVLLFTGLTAYDTQKIKNLAHMPEYQEHSDSLVKLSVMGALTLYLDFINLFLFLLQLFASRD